MEVSKCLNKVRLFKVRLKRLDYKELSTRVIRSTMCSWAKTPTSWTEGDLSGLISFHVCCQQDAVAPSCITSVPRASQRSKSPYTLITCSRGSSAGLIRLELRAILTRRSSHVAQTPPPPSQTLSMPSGRLCYITVSLGHLLQVPVVR